ncbi:hypothetical protein J6590_014381 [Homalodisca vitripennis]|nr:hypothetical protein J6590_014381 [Homalodisca vitripennis]
MYSYKGRFVGGKRQSGDAVRIKADPNFWLFINKRCRKVGAAICERREVPTGALPPPATAQIACKH